VIPSYTCTLPLLPLYMKPNLLKSLSSSSWLSLFSHHKLSLFSFHTICHNVANLQTCKESNSATPTHSNVVKLGLSNDTFTTNNLIKTYLRLLRIDHAQKLFDEMPHRNCCVLVFAYVWLCWPGSTQYGTMPLPSNARNICYAKRVHIFYSHQCMFYSCQP
jgi:pentatricopeptide repeat protein